MMRPFPAAYQVSLIRYRPSMHNRIGNLRSTFELAWPRQLGMAVAEARGGGSDMKSHYLSNKIGRILAALFFLVSIGLVSSTAVQAQWPYPQDRDRDRDYRRDRDR